KNNFLMSAFNGENRIDQSPRCQSNGWLGSTNVSPQAKCAPAGSSAALDPSYPLAWRRSIPYHSAEKVAAILRFQKYRQSERGKYGESAIAKIPCFPERFAKILSPRFCTRAKIFFSASSAAAKHGSTGHADALELLMS